jgi:hypothetical protein
MILRRASGIAKNSPLSISGNSFICPDFGGHSRVKVLLFICDKSQFPTNAHAQTRLPDLCRISPRYINGSVGGIDVSSTNSRFAASSPSSPSSISPLGIDQAPSSFMAQNGPPGWTRKTSTMPPDFRYINSPALTWDTVKILAWRGGPATRQGFKNSGIRSCRMGGRIDDAPMPPRTERLD